MKPRGDAGVALGRDWIEFYDEGRDRYYFYNVATAETTWTRPAPPGDDSESEEDSVYEVLDDDLDDDFVGPDDSMLVAAANFAAERKRRVESQPTAANSRVKRRD